MITRSAVVLIAALSLFAAGCEEEDNALNDPYIERYTGTYMYRDTTKVMDLAKIDSVDYTVTDGYTYSMSFWAMGPTDDVDFCDHQGRLETNTANIMEFEPVIQLSSNCDSLRIPRGDFNTDYRTHAPDTIYIEKREDSLLWRLVVLPR